MIQLPTVEHLTDAVIWLITDSGLSHRRVADLIGVNHNQVDRWVAGRGVPSPRSLIALAHDRRYTLALVPTRTASTTHLAPPDGSGVTGCCGLPPFELPRADRMTTGEVPVTCPGRPQPPHSRFPHRDTWPMVGQV